MELHDLKSGLDDKTVSPHRLKDRAFLHALSRTDWLGSQLDLAPRPKRTWLLGQVHNREPIPRTPKNLSQPARRRLRRHRARLPLVNRQQQTMKVHRVEFAEEFLLPAIGEAQEVEND